MAFGARLDPSQAGKLSNFPNVARSGLKPKFNLGRECSRSRLFLFIHFVI